MNYCPHNPDEWGEDDDGIAFCPKCNSGVCDICGALYEPNGNVYADGGAPVGEPYETGCDCYAN